jgi:hypothetical protein
MDATVLVLLTALSPFAAASAANKPAKSLILK